MTATSPRTKLLERRDTALLMIGMLAAARVIDLCDLRVESVFLRAHELSVHFPSNPEHSSAPQPDPFIPVPVDHQICTACACMRWLQVLSAWEAHTERSDRHLAVSTLIEQSPPFDDHVCHGSLSPIPAHAPLFRAISAHDYLSRNSLTPQSVTATLRRRAELAGLDGTGISGSSLRLGFTVQSVLRDQDPSAIMLQTGHHDPKYVMWRKAAEISHFTTQLRPDVNPS